MHLMDEIYEMEAMVKNKFRHYKSGDPLDLGEALWVSCKAFRGLGFQGHNDGEEQTPPLQER